MLRLIACVLLFIITTTVYSQNTNITARLTIYKGVSVDNVYFNSMDKYKTGKTLNQYTNIAVYWQDDSGNPDPDLGSAPHNWELRVAASGPTLVGELAGNTLPLNTVRLLAEHGGGTTPLGPFCQPEGPLQVPPAELVLVTGAPVGDSDQNRVNITYKFGTVINPVDPDYNKLLGNNNRPDVYTIDLLFTLTEVGW